MVMFISVIPEKRVWKITYLIRNFIVIFISVIPEKNGLKNNLTKKFIFAKKYYKLKVNEIAFSQYEI